MLNTRYDSDYGDATYQSCVCVTLTFDLRVNACRATVIEYMCTKFGVDSSRRFPVRVQTNRQTDRQTDRQMQLNAPPHAGGYGGVGSQDRHAKFTQYSYQLKIIYSVNNLQQNSVNKSIYMVRQKANPYCFLRCFKV